MCEKVFPSFETEKIQEKNPFKSLRLFYKAKSVYGKKVLNFRVKLQKGEYKMLPDYLIPRGAFLVPSLCTLLDFDKIVGHAYLRFRGDFIEEHHLNLMEMMQSVYNCADRNLISINNSQLVEGDIIVAKIKDMANPQDSLFIRGRILKVVLRMITLVNIDDQKVYEVNIKNIFWIFECFLDSPMMSIKCNLRSLERLAGYGAIARSTDFFALVIAESSTPSIPTVELYKTFEEGLKAQGR